MYVADAAQVTAADPPPHDSLAGYGIVANTVSPVNNQRAELDSFNK
jgi:hypothetical protein